MPSTDFAVQLFEIENRQDKLVEPYREYLYQNRLQEWSRVRSWIMGDLRIFGFRIPTKHLPASVPSQVDFNYLIHASPAELAVTMRHRFADEHVFPGNPVIFRVYDPLKGYAYEKLIPDFIPLSLVIQTQDFSLTLAPSPAPNNQTFLNISLLDQEEVWKLWDILRDEMEKAGYTHIYHTIPKLDNGNKIKQNQPPSGQPWEAVPDVGQNQLILKLWYEGCTAKEIGQSIGRTDKTINNLLALWRKEYGESVVPRRR